MTTSTTSASRSAITHPPGTTGNGRNPAQNALPRYYEEAEWALLGAMLLEPDIIPGVESQIGDTDFAITRHGWIFTAILAVHARNEIPDHVSVSAELEARGQHDQIGGPFLGKLVT